MTLCLEAIDNPVICRISVYKSETKYTQTRCRLLIRIKTLWSTYFCKAMTIIAFFVVRRKVSDHFCLRSNRKFTSPKKVTSTLKSDVLVFGGQMENTKAIYTPSFFKVEDVDIIYEFLQRNSFGTIITVGSDGSPNISRIPFLFKREGSTLKGYGHMAYANPQWKQLQELESNSTIEFFKIIDLK